MNLHIKGKIICKLIAKISLYEHKLISFFCYRLIILSFYIFWNSVAQYFHSYLHMNYQLIFHNQVRHSNQCHRAMARVDFLPRKFASKHCLQASLVIYYISLGSGTGCLYCRLAPLVMILSLWIQQQP